MSRQESAQRAGGRTWKRLALLGLILALFVAAYVALGDRLTIEHLARRETELRDLEQRSPMLVYGAAFLLYVVVTGLSLPGATAMSLVYGWYFGVVSGVILVSFASTTGAMFAFLLSRYLFREAIRRQFGQRLEKFNASLEREGPFYLFLLRLIPAAPFFVINLVMGLTPIRAWTFWWVSQIGMLPGTIVYIYAGSSVPSLQRLAEDGIRAVFTTGQITQIITAFALLGLFPLAARWILRRISRRSPHRPATEEDAGDPPDSSPRRAGP